MYENPYKARTKELADVLLYNSYNDFVAAKVEEMSDMTIALLQYEDAGNVLKMAQFSWLYEYFVRKHKNRI
jgi:hypothetical protein